MANPSTEHPTIQKARRLIERGVLNEDTRRVVAEYLECIDFHRRLGNAKRVTTELQILAERLEGY